MRIITITTEKKTEFWIQNNTENVETFFVTVINSKTQIRLEPGRIKKIKISDNDKGTVLIKIKHRSFTLLHAENIE